MAIYRGRIDITFHADDDHDAQDILRILATELEPHPQVETADPIGEAYDETPYDPADDDDAWHGPGYDPNADNVGERPGDRDLPPDRRVPLGEPLPDDDDYTEPDPEREGQDRYIRDEEALAALGEARDRLTLHDPDEWEIDARMAESYGDLTPGQLAIPRRWGQE